MKNMEEIYQSLSTIQSGNTLLLDVRSPEEYQGGHIPGSVNIPHTELDNKSADEFEDYSDVYVYCQMGGRAGMAADLLARKGLKNIHCINENGMAYWHQNSYPTE